VAVPSKVVPEKKSTLVTVAPALAAAVAASGTGVPTVRLAPAVGLVRATVGATVAAVAVTVTAEEQHAVVLVVGDLRLDRVGFCHSGPQDME